MKNVSKRHQMMGVYSRLFLSLFACKLAYALLFRELAHKESVVFLCHDVAFKPLYHHLLLFCGMNDAVGCVVDADVVAYEAVAIQVVVCVHEQ